MYFDSTPADLPAQHEMYVQAV
jgi:myosin VIIa